MRFVLNNLMVFYRIVYRMFHLKFHNESIMSSVYTNLQARDVFVGDWDKPLRIFELVMAYNVVCN